MGMAAEAVYAILQEQAVMLVSTGAWRGATLRARPI
jgi:hypothetical protein